MWIFPLKMVIFHSFLYVYQRFDRYQGAKQLSCSSLNVAVPVERKLASLASFSETRARLGCGEMSSEKIVGWSITGSWCINLWIILINSFSIYFWIKNQCIYYGVTLFYQSINICIYIVFQKKIEKKLFYLFLDRVIIDVIHLCDMWLYIYIRICVCMTCLDMFIIYVSV